MKKGSPPFHAFVVDTIGTEPFFICFWGFNLKNFHALKANLYFMLLNQGHSVTEMMIHGTFFHLSFFQARQYPNTIMTILSPDTIWNSSPNSNMEKDCRNLFKISNSDISTLEYSISTLWEQVYHFGWLSLFFHGYIVFWYRWRLSQKRKLESLEGVTLSDIEI